ncbi:MULTISPECIES: DUF6920 family protein [unclassified Calothrix]|uniref:DUF6920 family protein n=1 Tax=unclassified Calothrix TaxID=2619626 RepID=UPI0018F03220|nr:MULTISPECIES: DUF6544 family protein [unclassified Calothrix]
MTINYIFHLIAVSLLAILSICIFIAIAIRIKTDREIEQIWRSLLAISSENRFTADMVADLPAPVQRYFLHAIAPGTLLATAVSLKMSGIFRMAQDKPWIPMQATEIIATLKGFVWKPIIGKSLFTFAGADYYANQSGRMRFFLWGLIPIVNAHNADINRSSIGRFVAELIWLPSALLPQNGVTWQAIDDNTIQANLKIDGEPVTLTMTIDAAGKLLKLSLLRWGEYTENGDFNYIPFGGEIAAEKTFGGWTIPYQMSVGWWFGTNRYSEFFCATIEQAEFC